MVLLLRRQIAVTLPELSAYKGVETMAGVGAPVPAVEGKKGSAMLGVCVSSPGVLAEPYPKPGVPALSSPCEEKGSKTALIVRE